MVSLSSRPPRAASTTIIRRAPACQGAGAGGRRRARHARRVLRVAAESAATPAEACQQPTDKLLQRWHLQWPRLCTRAATQQVGSRASLPGPGLQDAHQRSAGLRSHSWRPRPRSGREGRGPMARGVRGEWMCTPTRRRSLPGRACPNLPSPGSKKPPQARWTPRRGLPSRSVCVLLGKGATVDVATRRLERSSYERNIPKAGDGEHNIGAQPVARRLACRPRQPHLQLLGSRQTVSLPAGPVARCGQA